MEKIIKGHLATFERKYDQTNLFNDYLNYTAHKIDKLSADTFGMKETETQTEKHLTSVLSRYQSQDQLLIRLAFEKITLELHKKIKENPFSDLLGEYYMNFVATPSQQNNGMFFTAPGVTQLLANLITNLKSIEKSIFEKGYIEHNDPCCGMGALTLAHAKAFYKSGYENEQFIATCIDINAASSYGCFIQLALNNVPAIVYHGNTLTLENYAGFITPALANIIQNKTKKDKQTA